MSNYDLYVETLYILAMNTMLNTRLFDAVEACKKSYLSSTPSPYFFWDGIVSPDYLEKIVQAIPAPELAPIWYDPKLFPFEPNKRVMSRPPEDNQYLWALIEELKSLKFLEFLKQVTGIPNLFLDDTFHSGFINHSPRGGKLGIHRDTDYHSMHANWRRQIVLIMYFTPDWNPKWGGDFQFWKGESADGYTVQSQVSNIECRYNRLFVFHNDSNAYHGYPYGLTCPDGVFRTCLILEYCTADDEVIPSHRGGRYFRVPTDPDTPGIREHIDLRVNGATQYLRDIGLGHLVK